MHTNAQNPQGCSSLKFYIVLHIRFFLLWRFCSWLLALAELSTNGWQVSHWISAKHLKGEIYGMFLFVITNRSDKASDYSLKQYFT
jgi:hypothetical protein